MSEAMHAAATLRQLVDTGNEVSLDLVMDRKGDAAPLCFWLRRL